MRFFGPENYHPDNHTTTPVGSPCSWCGEVFVEGDKGVAMAALDVDLEKDVASVAGILLYHESCNLRTMIGSIGHQQKRCPCFGGTEEDPPGMTKREAARLAVDYFVKPNKESSDA